MSNKCDICGSEQDVTPGRWLFYCPAHKQADITKTLENEIMPDLAAGNLDYLLSDPELAEIAEANL